MGYKNSKKYGSGIQLYTKVNGDISYFVTYKDEQNKLVRVKIGEKSKGITEPFCNKKRNEIINKIRLGEDIPIKKKRKRIITLNDIAKAYFKDKESAAKRVNKYNLHIEPYFGHNNAENITKNEILEFRDKILEKGKSIQTTKGIIQLLSTIFNYNIKEKNLKIYNPALGIKWDKKYKIDNVREKYLSLQEVKLLKDAIRHHYVLNFFIELSLQTGGRLETILNIRKKDISIEQKTVILKNLKTNNTYTGFLQASLINLLGLHIKPMKANDYIISFNEHSKATSRSIQSRLKPILDRLFNEGLDKKDSKHRTVIHTLRHTFASHLAIKGVPIFTIKTLMDHSDIEQTMRYAKLSPDNGRNAIIGLYE